MTFEILGYVCEGRGEARAFTQLDWVRQQFRDKVGFEPFPGTLNLRVLNPLALDLVRAQNGIAVESPTGYCPAKMFRVQIRQRTVAVWIIPQVPGYPGDMMELMAPVSLRDTLALKTGDIISLRFME